MIVFIFPPAWRVFTIGRLGLVSVGISLLTLNTPCLLSCAHDQRQPGRPRPTQKIDNRTAQQKAADEETKAKLSADARFQKILDAINR
jgi:hypothetical protein